MQVDMKVVIEVDREVGSQIVRQVDSKQAGR